MTQSSIPQTLTGRVAMVTGAGGGLGRGIALALAEAGARVVIAARRGVTGNETRDLIRAEGGEALALEVDVTVRTSVQTAVDETLRQFGGLDILIHNATHGAAGHPKLLEDFTDDDWDAQMAVDLIGAHHCAVSGFDALRSSDAPRMVFLCSAFGLHGGSLNPAYSAIKGGIRGLTKSLAREWGPYGITVNAISPSALTAPAQAFFDSMPEMRDAYLTKFPLGRIGNSREDVGRALAALCGPGMGYMTGQIISIDGGLYTAV